MVSAATRVFATSPQVGAARGLPRGPRSPKIDRVERPLGPKTTAARLGAALLSLTALGLVGCGGEEPPTEELGDRLWVSDMPTNARAQVNAFVITGVKNRSIGTYYHGSLFRGTHDTFTWKQGKKGKTK